MKLKILTHNSGEYETTESNYDPILMNEQLNNNQVNTVVIGDLIFSRIDIKAIVPIIE